MPFTNAGGIHGHPIGDYLTVPAGFASRNDAVHLHFADLPAADIVNRPGFRVTTPLRSLVDVTARSVDQDQLARAIAEARQRGLVSIRQLRARAEAIDARAALYIERALQRMDA